MQTLSETGFVLETACGQIKGEIRSGARLFRGVPYAEAERFERPKKLERWEGVFDATMDEIESPQYSAFRDEACMPKNFYYREFRNGRKNRYAESPLTLNIITPLEAKDCPVLVFFHGGAHETGTVGELPYGTCTGYAARGIILVSVGFRLNVFSLYEGGNYGLYDQIEALKWVQSNIADYGGDIERITLMGQSAGAMNVTSLCYTDKLKGIVSGAVLMSGGGALPKIGGPWSKEKAAPFWRRVRHRAGARDSDEMKSLPAETVWEAWFAESRAQNNLHLQQPSIDGDIIPDEPTSIMRQGRGLDIPVIVGVTSRDIFPLFLYETALRWGLRNSRTGRQPVYGYFFDKSPPGDDFGAFHASDLWYMFGNMDKSWRPFDDSDLRLSAEMMDYVAAFAKSGDPNSKSLPEWSPISRRQKGFRLFDGQSRGMIYPFRSRAITLRTMLFFKAPNA